MGRRPNPIVLRYFERGRKVCDSSNRYSHTCKLCGERFPKGRADTLMAHITKKCALIHDEEKIKLCFELHGPLISHPNQCLRPGGTAAAAAAADGPDRPSSDPETTSAATSGTGGSGGGSGGSGSGRGTTDTTISHPVPVTDLRMPFEFGPHRLPSEPRLGSVEAASHAMVTGSGPLEPWNPLDTLAEASLQAGEKRDRRAHTCSPQQMSEGHSPPPAGPAGSAGSTTHSPQQTPDLQDTSPYQQEHHGNGDGLDTLIEDRVRELLPASTSIIDAAATTTRQASPILIDDSDGDTPMSDAPSLLAPAAARAAAVVVLQDAVAVSSDQSRPGGGPAQSSSPPPYHAVTALRPVALPHARTTTPFPPPPAFPRGGVRMDRTDLSHKGGGHQSKHTRAKFTPGRRKEVQEVRKMGACIRCRILRKTCGMGNPCETCKRVLSPRVWKTGCIRTRLHEQLELYSAGVHVTLASRQIREWSSTIFLASRGSVVEISQLRSGAGAAGGAGGDGVAAAATTGPKMRLEALDGDLEPSEGTPDDAEAVGSASKPEFRPIMLDPDSVKVVDKIEAYMRAARPDLIAQEPLRFTRRMLEFATQLVEQGPASETDVDLLRKALDLWGYVELADRERDWHIVVLPARRWSREKAGSDRGGQGEEGGGGEEEEGDDDDGSGSQQRARVIERAGTSQSAAGAEDGDVYGMMSMQLSAVLERKSGVTSLNLLSLLQRVLQDSKIKIGFPVFLASVVFMAAVEKTTWVFKAWELGDLRRSWPLSRAPETFPPQVATLAILLRTLLSTRKILPITGRDEWGRLAAAETADPMEAEFFKHIDLEYAEVLSRHENCPMDRANSRSLELHYCSYLLLPQIHLMPA